MISARSLPVQKVTAGGRSSQADAVAVEEPLEIRLGYRGDDGRTVILAAPPSANLTDLQFCDHRGDVDTGGGIAAGRWIRLTPNGRPQLVRERARLQSVDNPLGGC